MELIYSIMYIQRGKEENKKHEKAKRVQEECVMKRAVKWKINTSQATNPVGGRLTEVPSLRKVYISRSVNM